MPFCQVSLSAQKPPDPRYPQEFRTIGDHLRKRRLDLRLGAKEVARTFGVRRDTYYGWEYGRFNPRNHRFSQIIDFLGYTPGDLLQPFCGEILRKFRQLHGVNQKKLAAILGINHVTLYFLEHDKQRPSMEIYQRILSTTVRLTMRRSTASDLVKQS